MPKRQTEQITQAVSGDFDAFYELKKREEPESKDALLILTTDAKGIVVRHDDLRGGDTQSGGVTAVMRAHATRQALTPEQRDPVDKFADYLLKYKAYLDYKTALEKGWPIATGIIEGACRHLIKDRMDITDARWSLSGTEVVLKLRALKSSDDFDAYMDFHKEKEHARNYQWMGTDMPKAA